uniref:Uncharacterized protein n=1 Tax=Pyxicephalus adspersus TaxID=30357 RepID=A0AAV3A3S2_PYXAD|nr:TPA: hypothetical protein GDO54_014908 [Pyxicephalus adspersus]
MDPSPEGGTTTFALYSLGYNTTRWRCCHHYSTTTLHIKHPSPQLTGGLCSIRTMWTSSRFTNEICSVRKCVWLGVSIFKITQHCHIH